MRNSSDPVPSGGRRRRDRLQVAIVINQLATPGLGSWIAGHRLAGAGQLILACAGFVLFVGYFVLLVVASWRASELGTELALPPSVWWKSGLVWFGIAWLWAGVTSLQMFAELRRRAAASPAEPPRLA